MSLLSGVLGGARRQDEFFVIDVYLGDPIEHGRLWPKLMLLRVNAKVSALLGELMLDATFYPSDEPLPSRWPISPPSLTSSNYAYLLPWDYLKVLFREGESLRETHIPEARFRYPVYVGDEGRAQLLVLHDRLLEQGLVES